MSSMLESKRSTRGLRMADLVGQAAEDDEQFWNNDVWNEEGSDADSFKSEDEEQRPDEFDSDFNDSETEEESGSDEDNVKKDARAQTVKQSKASNVYKDPSAAAPRAPAKRQLDQDGNPVPVQKRRTADVPMVHDGPLERTVRGSTKAKTQTAEEADKIRAKEQARAMKAKLSVDKPIRTGFMQKDLLQEALDTEETNAKWLVAQSFQESERAQADKPVKTATADQYIRFSSRRGTYNTVTFSCVEIVPEILNSVGPEGPPAGPQVCFITGLPAKYRDPRTLLPFATAEAFREIRRRYPSAVSVMASGRR